MRGPAIVHAFYPIIVGLMVGLGLGWLVRALRARRGTCERRSMAGASDGWIRIRMYWFRQVNPEDVKAEALCRLRVFRSVWGDRSPSREALQRLYFRGPCGARLGVN